LWTPGAVKPLKGPAGLVHIRLHAFLPIFPVSLLRCPLPPSPYCLQSYDYPTSDIRSLAHEQYRRARRLRTGQLDNWYSVCNDSPLFTHPTGLRHVQPFFFLGRYPLEPELATCSQIMSSPRPPQHQQSPTTGLRHRRVRGCRFTIIAVSWLAILVTLARYLLLYPFFICHVHLSHSPLTFTSHIHLSHSHSSSLNPTSIKRSLHICSYYCTSSPPRHEQTQSPCSCSSLTAFPSSYTNHKLPASYIYFKIPSHSYTSLPHSTSSYLSNQHHDHDPERNHSSHWHAQGLCCSTC